MSIPCQVSQAATATAAAAKKSRQKFAIWAPSHNSGYIFATKARIDNREKTC